MEHLVTIKLMPTGDDVDAGELHLELYFDGTTQIIQTPEKRSFFISRPEAEKLIDGLQQGLSKLPRRYAAEG
jgi:hypothetical protein